LVEASKNKEKKKKTWGVGEPHGQNRKGVESSIRGEVVKRGEKILSNGARRKGFGETKKETKKKGTQNVRTPLCRGDTKQKTKGRQNVEGAGNREK